MEGLTTAFWGMTINNYDETDMAMVHSGYPDYMREFVHTFEQGEAGTPHIQAWIKLQRQQRLSFVKKLFPRGHFKALTSDEYKHNTKSYAQKLDGTARSPAIHTFNDPMNTIESVVKKVLLEYIELYPGDVTLLNANLSCVQRDMVVKDYKYAKIFVSSTYSTMMKRFGHEMYLCVCQQHTHTHTHTENLISRVGSITDDSRQDSEAEDEPDEEESTGFYGSEDDEGDAGSVEGSNDSNQESDCS